MLTPLKIMIFVQGEAILVDIEKSLNALEFGYDRV
jgi:hypothetical protein